MTPDVPFVMVLMEGILTFVSPCILPMLPIYFIYLAGSDTEFSKEAKRKLIFNALAFVLGFTIVFTLLGASATAIGSILNQYRDFFRQMSGVIIVMFGLYFLGVFKLNFLNQEKRLHLDIKNPGFFGSILFGMVFSFGWTACAGPFLGAALLVAGNMETIGEGVLLLLVYSLGLGIPFMLSAVLFEQMQGVFTNLQKHHKTIKMISGVLLIIMGILVLTGMMQYFGTY